MVRLHLGSGGKYREGWINVDLYDARADIKADLRKLPFDDNYADCVEAIHVFEHFYIWEAEDVLREWYRVLKPGGTIALEMPDLGKIVRALSSPGVDITPWIKGLYGEWKGERPEMTHQWCWNISMIKPFMEAVGFGGVTRKEAEYHVPLRDFRVEAVK